MLSLDDPRWKGLLGGYKIPYDASRALARLERGDDVWQELWQELHHQGDLGDASYAAVPQLVRIAGASRPRDWNFYALLSTIEVERHRKNKPPIPGWLEADYRDAWQKVLDLALADLRDGGDVSTARSALGAVALAKGTSSSAPGSPWSTTPRSTRISRRRRPGRACTASRGARVMCPTCAPPPLREPERGGTRWNARERERRTVTVG